VNQRFALALIVGAALVSAPARAQTSPAPSNEDCQACHSEGSTAPSVFAQSVHAPLGCIDCHADLAKTTEFPHAENLKPPICATCHEDVVAQYQDSIHEEGRNGTAPTCATCHSAHSIRRTDTANFQLDVIQECGTCHVDKIRTYRDTFHGQVTALGFERVAKCADCHTPHHILPASNPGSSVSRVRLVATCSRCHETANERFVQYDPHPNPHDYQRNPVLWWVNRFYTVLIAGCFSLFGLHSLLWFWRSRKEARESGR
jgi:nitrate/TMAO reductase-like tetraheme cytochrome c subunit